MREIVKHYSTHILFFGSVLDIVGYVLDADGRYLLLSGVVKILALGAKFIPQEFGNAKQYSIVRGPISFWRYRRGHVG